MNLNAIKEKNCTTWVKNGQNLVIVTLVHAILVVTSSSLEAVTRRNSI